MQHQENFWTMVWEVQSSKNMSANDQAGFIQIVKNAIHYKGLNNRSAVAKYVWEQCQKEFPDSGKTWVVLYDTNGNFSIYTAPYKKIFLCEPAGNDEWIYAALVWLNVWSSLTDADPAYPHRTDADPAYPHPFLIIKKCFSPFFYFCFKFLCKMIL